MSNEIETRAMLLKHLKATTNRATSINNDMSTVNANLSDPWDKDAKGRLRKLRAEWLLECRAIANLADKLA